MRIIKTLTASALASIFATGCGQAFQSQSLTSLSSDLNNGVGCTDARAKIFDTYSRAYETTSDLSGVIPKTHGDRYQKSLQAIHNLLTDELHQTRATIVQSKASEAKPALVDDELAGENEDSDLLHLARLEMRSHIEPQYDVLNAKLDVALAEAGAAAAEAGVLCASPVVTPPAGQPAQDTVTGLTVNNPLYGALFTMATSYQSCQVLALQPVSASTEAAQGVGIGTTVDGIGNGRIYKDVALIKKTHYYHRGNTYGPGCVDQSKAPMVYDYGGIAVPETKGLNMFKNSGGGSAMGIDCSAFVSASVAVAGNLYKPSTSKSPSYRRFVSRDFINPATSGWSCYGQVKPDANDSIESGDIGAVVGHVLMVDKVGADPFGIAKIKTAAGCAAMTVANFDFSVVQSSPEKGNLGINRFLSKDYLAKGGKMATLFLAYGKAACLAHFDGKARNPGTSTYGIIRHSQTSSCLAQKTTLTNEACVAGCSSLREYSAN